MFFTGSACSFRLRKAPMKDFPLQSLTIIEAQQKQFALVDSI
ncbi:hypothetical protein ACNKHW_21365 [Shigella flexneri]